MVQWRCLLIPAIAILVPSLLLTLSSHGKEAKMSRCSPYPPPGYEKKDQLLETKVHLTDPITSSKKKGKHKHREKKEKKDKSVKKKRTKEADYNGDFQDRERHGDAKLVRVKPNDKKSSDAARDLNHWWPTSSGGATHLKNGKVLEPESSYYAPNFAGKAELSMKIKEVKLLVVSKHLNNGQAGNHVNQHLVPSNGEDRTFDNALKAEQSWKYKEHMILVAARHNNNGQVGEFLSKHPAIIKEQEFAAAIVTPVESGNSHPILPSVHKEQKLVDRDHDQECKPLDTSAEVVDSRWVDSSLTSGSGKRKHSRFKGFLEFPSPTQPDDWTADCESWLSPMSRRKDDPNLKVERQCCTFRLSVGVPFSTNQPVVGQENNAELKDESAEVWAEAVFLPSVSIHALPYVVPY